MLQYIPGAIVFVVTVIGLVWTIVWCKRKRAAFNSDIAKLKDVWETQVRPKIERKPSELERAIGALIGHTYKQFGDRPEMGIWDDTCVQHNEWINKIGISTKARHEKIKALHGARVYDCSFGIAKMKKAKERTNNA